MSFKNISACPHVVLRELAIIKSQCINIAAVIGKLLSNHQAMPRAACSGCFPIIRKKLIYLSWDNFLKMLSLILGTVIDMYLRTAQ